MELELEVVNSELLPPGCQSRFVFGSLGGLIGRADDCDWVIADAQRHLSARHAILRYEGGRFFIIDVSTNGIFLNQDELPLSRELPIALQQGDLLSMGELCFRVNFRTPVGALHSHVRLANPEDITVRHPLPEQTLLAPQWVRDAQRIAKLPTSTPPTMPRQRPEPVSAAPDDALLSVHPQSPAPGFADRAVSTRQDALLAAFCRGLGVPVEVFDRVDAEAVMERAGACLQVCFQGMMGLMQQRAQLKHHLRVELTFVRNADNNPLKFTVSQKQLLRYFLKPDTSSFMAMDAALQECFDDVAAHQAAVVAGAQEALVQWADRLNPEQIETRINLRRGKGLQWASRKSQCWQAFRALYSNLVGEGDVFERAFGAAFAHAYQQALLRSAKQAARQRLA